MLHFTAFDDLTTLIAAFKFSLLTLVSDVHVHVILNELAAAIEETIDETVRTNLAYMRLQVLSFDQPALLYVVWACYGSEVAVRDVSFLVAPSHY